MSDKRLFHRYPSGLEVAFRAGERRFRGRITDVSAGGGYVSSDAIPPVGARVQMRKRDDKHSASVWLDLRVIWVNEDGTDSHPPGFGGYWGYASARSEEALCDFLSDVLGITRPVVRPMAPPAGGATVYIHRFQDIYDLESGDDVDFPWDSDREPLLKSSDTRVRRKKSKSGLNPISATDAPPGDSSAGINLDSVKVRADAAPAAFSQQTMAALDLGQSLDAAIERAEAPPRPRRAKKKKVEDEAGAVRRPTSEAEPVEFVVFEAPEAPEEPEEPEVEESAAPTAGGSRWGFLVRKLSAVRNRSSDAAPAQLDLSGSDFVVKYKHGRKQFAARVDRLDTSHIVLAPSGDIPEVYARVEIEVPTGTGKRAKSIQVQATVTRLKEQAEQDLVYCTVNRVDEKGQNGAWQSYIEAFRARET